MATPGDDLQLENLYAQMIDAQKKVKSVELQMEQLSCAKEFTDFTHIEIVSMSDTTRMYESVGHAFILQSKDEINNRLTDRQETHEQNMKVLEQRKVYLERSVREAQENISEMLLSRRSQ